MPELPEVETVIKSLEVLLKNKKIINVEVRYKPIVVDSLSKFKNSLIGRRFINIKRRGKYILFYLDDIILVSHLRMEGKYELINDKTKPSIHTHVIFYLDDGNELRYIDTRKFGRFELFPLDTNLELFKNLGPEPFSNTFNEKYFFEYIKNKKVPIKKLLLDQHFVAGIGNIYADEILYDSSINPTIKACQLTTNNINKIIDSTKKILRNAINDGGTTIKSFSSVNHINGRFQRSLNVHTKTICKKCNSRIRIIRINGRSTYYCPKCQKA